MAKSKVVPVKSRNLDSKWQSLYAHCDQFFADSWNLAVRSIEQGILQQTVDMLSDKQENLSGDEQIILYYQDLMQLYVKVIQLYLKEKTSLVDAEVIKILDGICLVLYSQIKAYEENEIISSVLLGNKNVDSALRESLNRWITELFDSESDSINTIRKKMFDYFFYKKPWSFYQVLLHEFEDDIYKLYIRIFEEHIASGQELKLMQAAEECYNALKHEKENLESIIKIQVQALESRIDSLEKSDEQERAVQSILRNLREPYQILGRQMAEMDAYWSQREKLRKHPIAQKQLVVFLLTKHLHSAEMEKRKMDLEKAIHVFYAQFDGRANTAFRQAICWNENQYRQKKQATEMNLLAKDIIKCFEALPVAETESVKSPEAADIIKGIQETITIKVQSLQESRSYYREEISKGVYKDAKPFLNKESLELLFLDFIYCCVEDTKCRLDHYLKHLKMNKICETEIAAQAKIIQTKHEAMNQQILRYLKEQLLFEISTFQEIIQYSVKRIREVEDLPVKAYVEALDRVSRELAVVLKKYGIQLISPQNGDDFNAKEHEILYAEKNEELPKGKIIKLMNDGYRYSDTVVVRANVVASK